MYERFTDRARKVIALANQEAQRFNHEYIGTEHLLLGLTKEGSGVASTVLKNLDIDLRRVRLEVEKLVKSSQSDMRTMGKLPQTPRVKKAIEYAIEESRGLGHNYIGTEHLLLGLLRETDGVAAQVLMNLGLKVEAIREEIIRSLGITKNDEPALIGVSGYTSIGLSGFSGTRGYSAISGDSIVMNPTENCASANNLNILKFEIRKTMKFLCNKADTDELDSLLKTLRFVENLEEKYK